MFDLLFYLDFFYSFSYFCNIFIFGTQNNEKKKDKSRKYWMSICWKVLTPKLHLLLTLVWLYLFNFQHFAIDEKKEEQNKHMDAKEDEIKSSCTYSILESENIFFLFHWYISHTKVQNFFTLLFVVYDFY